MTVDEMSQSKLVAADVALRLIGQPGVVLVSLTVMLSTLGTLNGSILTNPRVFFAMAADGMLFRKVAAVHPKYQTPYVAIMLAAVLGIIFVLLRTFEQLADTFVTAILPFYALGVASIFVFRRRGYNPPFRAPLYPFAPICSSSATVYLLANALIDESSRMADARDLRRHRGRNSRLLLDRWARAGITCRGECGERGLVALTASRLPFLQAFHGARDHPVERRDREAAVIARRNRRETDRRRFRIAREDRLEQAERAARSTDRSAPC